MFLRFAGVCALERSASKHMQRFGSSRDSGGVVPQRHIVSCTSPFGNAVFSLLFSELGAVTKQIAALPKRRVLRLRFVCH